VTKLGFLEVPINRQFGHRVVALHLWSALLMIWQNSHQIIQLGECESNKIWISIHLKQLQHIEVKNYMFTCFFAKYAAIYASGPWTHPIQE